MLAGDGSAIRPPAATARTRPRSRRRSGLVGNFVGRETRCELVRPTWYGVVSTFDTPPCDEAAARRAPRSRRRPVVGEPLPGLGTDGETCLNRLARVCGYCRRSAKTRLPPKTLCANEVIHGEARLRRVQVRADDALLRNCHADYYKFGRTRSTSRGTIAAPAIARIVYPRAPTPTPRWCRAATSPSRRRLPARLPTAPSTAS